MRSFNRIDRAPISSYLRQERHMISTAEPHRRYSSSITRQSRSSSKNHKFDMAVSSIANISSSINGLLNIVRRDRSHLEEDRIEIQRVLHQSKEKHHPKVFQKIYYSNNYQIASPFKDKVSKYDKKVSPYDRQQKFSASASIKYKNSPNYTRDTKEELLSTNIQKDRIKNDATKAPCTPNRNPKRQLFGQKKDQRIQNDHQVSDWWDEMLNQVDENAVKVEYQYSQEVKDQFLNQE